MAASSPSPPPPVRDAMTCLSRFTDERDDFALDRADANRLAMSDEAVAFILDRIRGNDGEEAAVAVSFVKQWLYHARLFEAKHKRDYIAAVREGAEVRHENVQGYVANAIPSRRLSQETADSKQNDELSQRIDSIVGNGNGIFNNSGNGPMQQGGTTNNFFGGPAQPLGYGPPFAFPLGNQPAGFPRAYPNNYPPTHGYTYPPAPPMGHPFPPPPARNDDDRGDRGRRSRHSDRGRERERERDSRRYRDEDERDDWHPRSRSRRRRGGRRF